MLYVVRTILFLVGFSFSAQAAEIFEPFQSIRQLGMGGVYVFNPEDASSFNQNPAYSCYTKGINWSLFDINLGINGQDVYETYQENGAPEGMADFGPYYGLPVWLNTGGYSTLTAPCFGFSGYYTGLVSFRLHNPAFPTMETFYVTDYGVSFGAAMQFGPNLSLGFAAKRITRKGGEQTFGPDTLSEMEGEGGLEGMMEAFQNEGVGYGFDVGLVSRFEDMPLNPTISLAWRDVGSTAFLKTKGEDAPSRQKDNLVLGLGAEGSVPFAGIAAGLEYRHITDTGEQIGKKIHAGMEMSLAFLDVRAGFYQGYYTYGVGIDLFIFEFDAAMYTVEKGIYPGQTPDQRYQIGIKLNLGFDPNFSLTEVGGQRRRLKQRR